MSYTINKNKVEIRVGFGQLLLPLPLSELDKKLLKKAGYNNYFIECVENEWNNTPPRGITSGVALGYLDSVAQGHTRDTPDHWNDYSYDLPDLPELPKTKKECKHEWYVTGFNFSTNKDYENCKHCDIKREDYDTNHK